MKKATLILTILFVSGAIALAQKTVLHTASGVQLFDGTEGFVSAYNAASSGDTIYLPGGSFTAPSSIDKQLRVYGAGHYPDSTQTTGKTFLTAGFALTENADGFYIEGVDITGGITLTTGNAVDNVIIKRCKMTTLYLQGDLSVPDNNLSLIGCVLTSDLNIPNAVNLAAYSNIVQGRVISSIGNTFKNNVFFFTYTGSASYYTINGDNNLCENNIFWNLSNRYFSGSGNQAYYNLFVISPYLGTTSMSSDNYYPVDQADIFINHTGTAFSYDYDYNLQNPETYLGADGLQVGIYGGIHAQKPGAVPSNPHIEFENIADQTDSNGDLNIKITVSAQNN